MNIARLSAPSLLSALPFETADPTADFTGQALIAFTYDDGLRSTLDHAVPLHLDYRIPATLAVIAGRLLGKVHWPRHIKPWEAVELSRLGFEIAAHGMSHATPYRDMTVQELKQDLTESKALLDGMVVGDKGVTSLCIPFSSYNDEIVARALKHYTEVRTCNSKMNRLTAKRGLLYSFGMQNTTTPEAFRDIVVRAVAERAVLIITMHGVVDGPGNRPRVAGKYEVTRDFLRQCLDHVVGLGRETILPFRMDQLALFRARVQKTGASATHTPAQVATAQDTPAPGPAAKGATAGPGLSAPRIDTVTCHRLAGNDDYRITLHRNTMDKGITLVSFGGLPSGISSKGFGTAFALKNGYDAIYVAQAAGSQYQGLSIEEFTEAIAPVVQGRRVVAYGSSLGAYCALYYGGAIDAQIISSAPKNSAHPSMLKKKYADLDFRHRDVVETPRSSKRPVVLYDPYREEETNFIESQVRPAYPDGHYLRFPFAGHTVLDTLLRAGKLSGFIRAIIEEDRILQPDLSTGTSAIWNAEVGRKLMREGNPEKAELFLTRSLDLEPTKSGLEWLIRLRLKQGNIAEARRLLDAVATPAGIKLPLSGAERKLLDKT